MPHLPAPLAPLQGKGEFTMEYHAHNPVTAETQVGEAVWVPAASVLACAFSGKAGRRGDSWVGPRTHLPAQPANPKTCVGVVGFRVLVFWGWLGST